MDWRVSGGAAGELGGIVAAQMCLQSQCICRCVSELVSGCEYVQARLIEAGVVGKVVGLLQHDCNAQQSEFVSDRVALVSHVMEPQGAKQRVEEMTTD